MTAMSTTADEEMNGVHDKTSPPRVILLVRGFLNHQYNAGRANKVACRCPLWSLADIAHAHSA